MSSSESGSMSVGSAWNVAQQEATQHFKGEKRVPFSEADDKLLISMVTSKKKHTSILQMAVTLERTWYATQNRISYLRKKGVLPRLPPKEAAAG